MSMKEGVVTEATNMVDKHGVALGESHHIERPHGARARKARKKKNVFVHLPSCDYRVWSVGVACCCRWVLWAFQLM